MKDYLTQHIGLCNLKHQIPNEPSTARYCNTDSIQHNRELFRYYYTSYCDCLLEFDNHVPIFLLRTLVDATSRTGATCLLGLAIS